MAGFAGFIAGAVCWHVVGFWSFVKEAVFFSRPDGPVQIGTRTAGAPGKAQSRQSGAAAPVLAVTSENCTNAGVNRTDGDAAIVGCEGAVSIKFRPARGIGRADRGDFGPSPVPTLVSSSSTPAPPAPAQSAVGGWSARIVVDGLSKKSD